MLETYYYQIDGVCYGEPREMSKQEADERNAALELGKCAARWLRQSEFCFIDEVKV